MANLLIRNANVVLPDRVAENWCVVCETGRIAWVGPEKEAPSKTTDAVVDARRRYLAPGFIDLHIHGIHEFLVNDGPESLRSITQILPRYGVTGFLPTLYPPPRGEDVALLTSLAHVRSEGASILGFLLEGPCLSVSGALPKESLGSADPKHIRDLIEAAKPHRTIFAVSPEFERLDELLPIMTEGGTPAFISHTRAGVDETRRAIAGNARHATHFYDVFYAPPEVEIGARPCGAVEAILADTRVSVDFILDGEHVHPVAVEMALRCKGPELVCLATDANRGAGLPPGTYLFGEQRIEFAYEGGPARFTKHHPEYAGALAGSGLTMDRALRNAVDMLDVDLPAAVRMVSANPARVLGLQGKKGKIAAGHDADMVLLDEHLFPKTTWVAGVRLFDSDEF